MADLKTAIETGVTRLQSTLTQLTIASSARTAVPLDCYRLWQQRAELHVPLKATLELLPMRDHACAVVKSVLDDENADDRVTSSVRFCGQVMPFATARHLALAAFLTTTWSVYDRLSNVCGRLIGHEDIGNNLSPKSNPKLIEHFMRESKERSRQHGFSLACLLPPAYGWPASVSYVVRNWLVHEGLEAEGVVLFRGNTLAEPFELSDAAMKRIERICTGDGFTHSRCCLSADPDHPWYDRTILTVLEKCHAEVDQLFCGLLAWSVSSFAGQVDAFSERDRGAMAAATVTTTTTTTT